MSDEFLIPPPASATVFTEDRPVLFKADGTPLKRQIGFVMSQTGGSFPALQTTGKKVGGKRGGKKKGC